MFVKIFNQQVEKYPYTIGDLRKDNPNTSFPKNPSSELLEAYGVFSVGAVTKPTETMTTIVEEADPQLVDGVWTQQWTNRSATPAEASQKIEILKRDVTILTQRRLDTFAQTRNYDNILSACTYATSTNATFAAEGQYCVEQRDATWTKLYEILAEVEAQTRPLPENFDAIEPELPILEWPAGSPA